MAYYNKLKKVAEAKDKTLNELIKEAIEEYAEKHATIDENDVLFVAEKFKFKENDLSEKHSKYRFRRE